MFRISFTMKDLDVFYIESTFMPKIGDGVLQVVISSTHAKYFPLSNISEIDIKKTDEVSE